MVLNLKEEKTAQSQDATGITLVKAINKSLWRAMSEDNRVVLLGEDIASDEGVFRATEGLLERFGEKRVKSTPLAEVGIVGTAIGMAAYGLIPVVEIQFAGFALAPFEVTAIIAARLRNRTRGRLTCPLVLRAPCGGLVGAPEHHSENYEGLFAAIPGLRVVIPTTPRRAYGLLLAAIRNPDPVVFFEPTRLYRRNKEKVADDGVELPLDQCFIDREGRDVTLVTWGASVIETLEAAEQLEGEGVSAEVIDVATLRNFDGATILASVEKTGRCVIVHEAPKTGSFGAEIVARIAEKALMSLQAPIVRVTGFDTHPPYPDLEGHYGPTTKRIVAAARKTMEY